MVCFNDSNYASWVDNKKFTSRYIFMMVEGAISWKSVKQTLATSCTIEAEYMVYYEAVCHAIWL